jgi:hypothetical protein
VSEVGVLMHTDLLAVRALRCRIRPVFAARDDPEAARTVDGTS